MASQDIGPDITLQASADLSAKQYYIVKVDPNGQVAVCGDGEASIGVLQNDPDAAGKEAVVRTYGKTKYVGDATTTVGSDIASDANGKGTATTASGDYVVGICTENPGADTQIGSMILTLGGQLN